MSKIVLIHCHLFTLSIPYGHFLSKLNHNPITYLQLSVMLLNVTLLIFDFGSVIQVNSKVSLQITNLKNQLETKNRVNI